MFIHTTSDSKNTRAAIVKPQNSLISDISRQPFHQEKSGTRVYLSDLDTQLDIALMLVAGRSQN